MTQRGFLPGDRLQGYDLAAHNDEMRAAWSAFREGTPYRVPILLGVNTRYFMFNAQANPARLEFADYFASADVMFDTLLQFQRWARFNLLQDSELGLPERWFLAVDGQNFYDAAWLGCPIEFMPGEVPDTRPVYADCPERVMEKGLPDPFGGLMARGLEYDARFRERAEQETFQDRPISIVPPGFGLGTDGILTCACNLFGPEFVCMTMASNPKRLHRLLDFITDALIVKMTAWRLRHEIEFPQDNFWLADDSIALISTRMYKEHILPYHRRIFDRFGTEKGRGMHLCGDATRHFPTLCAELKIEVFDTGFPVDFGALRSVLGPNICIQGGPHIELLRIGTPQAVADETRRILESGVLEGGRFILREGNNLAPYTPLENTEAMYHAGRTFGKLR